MALPQLVFFFLGVLTLRTQVGNLGNRYFGNTVAEIQNFLSPTFSSFSLILLLNFSNGIAEIHTFSSFR